LGLSGQDRSIFWGGHWDQINVILPTCPEKVPACLGAHTKGPYKSVLNQPPGRWTWNQCPPSSSIFSNSWWVALTIGIYFLTVLVVTCPRWGCQCTWFLLESLSLTCSGLPCVWAPLVTLSKFPLLMTPARLDYSPF
jgi:hypothetical protein